MCRSATSVQALVLFVPTSNENDSTIPDEPCVSIQVLPELQPDTRFSPLLSSVRFRTSHSRPQPHCSHIALTVKVRLSTGNFGRHPLVPSSITTYCPFNLIENSAFFRHHKLFPLQLRPSNLDCCTLLTLSDAMTDYLILGGGLAGCVLASRLKEYDASLRITVVEAGPNEHDHPLITEPMGTMQLHNSPFEYNYKTVPQKHYDGREVFQAGGKLLSGSSAV